MTDFEKGVRVKIVGGKGGVGVVGEIFWWGESNFGDGMRAGVAGDDGEKYWVDEDDLELADDDDVSAEADDAEDVAEPTDDSEVREFEKGSRVRVVKGKEKGSVGDIFWWGESKFGVPRFARCRSP